MTAWRPFCEAVHLVAVGLWLGSIVTTAGTAAIIFPRMKELAPALPGYAEYDGDHWRIAAGDVAQRFFWLSDNIQIVCAILAASTLLVLLFFLRLPLRRLSTCLRTIGLVGALGAFVWQFTVVTPAMNRSLRAYHTAAASGDHENAAEHQNAFGELHPTASGLLGFTSLALLLTLASGAWNASISGGRVSKRDGSPILEQPRLKSDHR